MSRIKEVFRRLKREGRCALIPYFMGFYPNSKVFESLLIAAQDSGADLVEVGIPFSDPIADGPTIQEAGSVALSQGATARKILDFLRKMRSKLSLPVIVMTYTNLILQYGIDAFFRDCASAEVEGSILADLPVEESRVFKAAAGKNNVDVIQLAAPTSTRNRLMKIARESQGFIYFVSVTGVTGARPNEKFELKSYIERLRAVSDLPICVGFGIATPKQAAAMARIVDGVIIGSAIIGTIKRSKGDAANAAVYFLRRMRKAIDEVGERI